MSKKFENISIEISRTVANEADLLRMFAFPGENYKITSEDNFDCNSLHITICIDKSIVAYARLTPGPNSVFHSWTQGKCSLPNDNESIDLGRMLVNGKFRGLGLLNLLLIESCLQSYLLGFKKINGTHIPEEIHMARCLHRVGFTNCGDTVVEHESGGISVLVQPVTCEITSDIVSLWLIKNVLGNYILQ
jgi:predicted GNAT family N-acyltransferase